jgi:hypothetical protein
MKKQQWSDVAGGDELGLSIGPLIPRRQKPITTSSLQVPHPRPHNSYNPRNYKKPSHLEPCNAESLNRSATLASTPQKETGKERKLLWV